MRLSPYEKALKTLDVDQTKMLKELTQLFDPTVSIKHQSVEYIELAKRFNATLNANQMCLARVTHVWDMN